MRLFRKPHNHLRGTPRHINSVFEPHRSLSDVMVDSLSNSSRQPRLPFTFKIAGYDFSIEYGLRPKPFARRWITPILLIISSLFMALVLLWSLNRTDVLVETNAFHLQSTPVVVPAVKKVKVDITPDDNCEKIGVHTENVAVRCQVNTSISALVQKGDLSEHLVEQLVKIFQWDIDFERDVRAGDRLTIIYDSHQKILAAKFINQGKVYRAIRYTDSTGTTNYYTPMGFDLQKISLLSAPLKYTRISSPFGQRKHPISKKFHFHNGIDYAAPWGTPIVAAGEATVTFVGRKGGYGKVVTLQHHQRVSSLYAHLSRYAKGLSVGDRVSQGQIIGYVGQSGQATGPHLHYEIQLDGVEINPPLLTGIPFSLPISKEQKYHFLRKSQRLLTQLDTFIPLTKAARSASIYLYPNAQAH